MHKGKQSAVMGVEPMEGGESLPPSYNLQEAEDAEFEEIPAVAPKTNSKRESKAASPVKPQGNKTMSPKLEKLKGQLSEVQAQTKELTGELKDARGAVRDAKAALREPTKELKAAESALAKGLKRKETLALKIETLKGKIADEK